MIGGKSVFYLVRFVRKDRQPNEEYYYRDLAGAEYHFSLFLEDDSGLYERIELVELTPEERLIMVNVYA